LKPKIDPQKEKLAKSIEKLEKASAELNTMMQEDLVSKVEKLQQLHDLHAKLLLESEKQKVDLVKNESAVTALESDLAASKARLVELERALNNRENEEVVSLRAKIEEYSKAASMLDKRKLDLASERGRIISDAEKALEEKKTKEQLLDKMKVYEMITTAFSKKGIPSVISTSQLPLINAEIHKILAGIVDFTIELEVDEESDSMDVYINYGDSKRVIELASGMEKMIGSIAIRVALINISSLPKTDMFIIDEGFGALDDSTVEACNRLLISLKRHFKTILVITHVDGVKDAADTILEISKVEKDSRVVYT
jgi:exonuclease SbcC